MVTACPSCNRRVFQPRDMLYATLDGVARCRACGRFARLDLVSRWMISCVLAVLVPNVLLYGGIFYSGHLFVVSMVMIYGAWGLLSFIGFPVLSLEPAAAESSIDRPKSILTMAVLLVAAIVIDSYIASKFETEPLQGGSSATAVHQSSSGDTN
jgi:hypothetical protein